LTEDRFNLALFLVVFFVSLARAGLVARLFAGGVGANETVAVAGQPACWQAIVRDRRSEYKHRLCGLGIIDEYGVDVADLPLFWPCEVSPPQSPDRREK
jgi:hypothetical protein